MKPNSWCASRASVTLLAVVLFLPASLLAEPVPLKRMVELALKHATASEIAEADVQRAADDYHELRDNYIPQLTVGAGLGWSYGFPLSLEGSAPSLFNVNAQSALLNPALRDFVRAARSESSAATLRSKDQRSQVIQNTVLSYAELQKWEQRLARLQQTQAEAQQTEAAVMLRIKQGVDSEVDGEKARLSVARVRLRISEAEGAAAVLRERLEKLTGLPAAGIQTEGDTIPAVPAIPDDAASKAADDSPAVQAAFEHARAQYLHAKGEHGSLWPSVDFAAQYALLSTYNNYNEFYKSFQRNNATVGVAVRIPFLNAAQKARAEAADADALKAKKQAEAARNQASEETLRLQRTVAQMQDARDVAELEYEIAQKNVDAVQTRMNAGTANLHDLDDARSQASERFIGLQDVTFELERSQVELMRSTGDLEHWALGN